MCGRFTLLLSWREIHELLAGFVSALKVNSSPQISEAPSRYNIAPTQPILALLRVGGTVEPQLMRWGLVPEWVDNPADFPLIINARSETLAEKTSFKHALKNRRCIIPASGYYEWLKNEDGSKTPIYVSRKDGKPFLMAGLFSNWVGPDGEEVDTTAIITVSANEELKKVHHRTPAILEGEHMADWLDTGDVNAHHAHELLTALPLGIAKYHPVSSRVNFVRNDDESLIIPAFEQEQISPKKPTKPKQLKLF